MLQNAFQSSEKALLIMLVHIVEVKWYQWENSNNIKLPAMKVLNYQLSGSNSLQTFCSGDGGAKNKWFYEVTSTVSGGCLLRQTAGPAAMLPHMAESLEFQAKNWHSTLAVMNMMLKSFQFMLNCFGIVMCVWIAKLYKGYHGVLLKKV